MPIKIPNDLPAKEVLEREQIFAMEENRAFHQDIRPLKIAILNLMPIKETTETQLLRLLGNSPLQADISLLRIGSHQSKNTPSEHLNTFYRTFKEVKHEKFDGLIITGAPIEHLEFEDVSYWSEFKEIAEWSLSHVTSTLYICWAAQAGLFTHFGIPKHPLADKIFGIFSHDVRHQTPLVRGFDEQFLAPHSRHTDVRREDILNIPELDLLAESDEAGVYLVATKDGRQVFVTGHSEYDRLTLKEEYDRDVTKGANVKLPQNYFPNDDPTQLPPHKWRSHASLLFANWLNYCVYQETPYHLEELPKTRP